MGIRSLGARAPIAFGANVDWIACSPDGRFLGVVGRLFDQKVETWVAKVFDLAAPAGTPPLELTEPDVTFITFSPNGRHFAAVCRDGKALLYDAVARKSACPPIAHAGLTSIGFSPDSQLLLTSGLTGDEHREPDRAVAYRAPVPAASNR